MQAGSLSMKRYIDQIISRTSDTDSVAPIPALIIIDHNTDYNALLTESTSPNACPPSVDPDISTVITLVSLTPTYIGNRTTEVL